MKNESYLRERLRAAGDDLASLFAVVLGTGFLLGLTSNIASSYLVERSPRWPWLLVSATTTLLLPVVFVWLVYSRGYSTESVFEVVIPFRVSDREAEILTARPYLVTRLLRRSFHAILDHGQNRERFIGDWRRAQREGKMPFQGLARTCVKDLLVYALLDGLREYSKQTLTAQWVFTGHRWKTSKLSASELPKSQWPQRLMDNLCFASTSRSSFQAIKVPAGISLDVRESKGAAGHEQIEVALRSRYGDLTFIIAPHAQRVNSQSREGSILYKYCKLGIQMAQSDEVWLAKFYVQVKNEFGGLGIFTRHFRDDVFPWLEKAHESIRDRLDWQLCLEKDLERMVVDLSEKMDSFLQRPAELAPPASTKVSVDAKSLTPSK